MKKDTMEQKEFVICRIGSLESRRTKYIFGNVVICRIGSLESYTAAN